MDITEKLAVQSYCFHRFHTNSEVIELLKRCGLTHVELWEGHGKPGDADNDDTTIDLYRQAGIEILSIGVLTLAGNRDREEQYFRFAAQAGATTISVNFLRESTPQSFHVAEELAEQYDVNLAIHNHGRRHWLGSAWMLEEAFAQTSPRIGLMLDTAWALDAGENPVEMIRQFASRLYGLHIKDFVFNRAGKPNDVIVGDGNLALSELLTALKRIDFRGHSILEYEGDVDNPVPALRRCVGAVQQAWLNASM